MRKLICVLLVSAVLTPSLTACSKEFAGFGFGSAEAKTPEDAINGLIAAYAANDLDKIREHLGTQHRFGTNIIQGLEWLGNCLKVMKQCIKTPVKVVETKPVGSEVAVAVLANNLVGAPMSVWFVTSLENGSYKVTGMNTRYECALKTPEQRAKEIAERQPGDYSLCF